MNRSLLTFLLSAAAFLAAVIAGCSGGPTVEPNPMTAYAPKDYREQRALYLRAADGKPDLCDLKFPHEVQKTESVDQLAVHHGDPISIVVSDVYLPHKLDTSDAAIDVVVLLDVQTSADVGLQSYALWYERGVHPGQRLNFSGALVYAERAWNSRHAPYFKLRVMDVSKERNAETQAAFEGLSSAVGNVAAFFPHPAIPGAAAAIRAAGLIASNRANYPIVDYTPQFFSDQFIKQAGPNDLALFARGSWMVVGRAPGQDESFWNTPLHMHLKTGQILDSADHAVPIPYMRMTVSTYETVVPSVILDRSKSLFSFLATQRAGVPEMVSSISNTLTSGIISYQVHARFADARTIETLGDLYNSANDNARIDPLDRDFLRNVFARITGQSGKSWADITSWWQSTGMRGEIDSRTGTWKPKGGS